MPLREHLRELRSRLLRASIAVVVGAVVGWLLYDWVLLKITQPLTAIEAERGTKTAINFSQVAASFNLKLQMSVYLGLIIASPVWLYQLWAFIVPGLTKREKRTAMAFVGVATPLFAAGVTVAWLVLPNAVRFLTDFVPANAVSFIDAEQYLTFVAKLFLAFGVAFVIPLFLVALNMIGVLSGIAMAKGWRVAVFLVFLFAAMASPTPDAGSMLALAFPMVGLYLLAVGFAILNDRRRAKANPFAGLDDDEASSLDDIRATPLDDVAGAAGPPTASSVTDDLTDGVEQSRSRYDDIT
jgi:sec-independent protein translocase protein TatC